MVQVAGMDQAHEQITDLCAMLGFIKQTVFAMQYILFQSPLRVCVPNAGNEKPVKLLVPLPKNI